ncbi:transposase [Amycolatopsis mediterranei]|uniref:IS701 family transposase n=1 Tax=Amycolatopsis mediterranei TaxID=33910 RepID=UPI0034163BC0
MSVDHACASPAREIVDLTTFTDQVFGPLARVDQRRWARAYLHGLLTVPGKKSLQRLAEAASGTPAACRGLRQFVNSSSWDWRPARRELTRIITEHAGVRALTTATLVIPKRGEHSVGVRRRFVAETGRTINCQVARGLFLITGEAAIPVDWELLLDESWLADEQRRRRARIPDRLGPRPEWAHLADFARLVPAPVVADLSGVPDAREAITRLAEANPDFIVRVASVFGAQLGRVVPARRGSAESKAASRGHWISGLAGRRPDEVMALARSASRTRTATRELANDFGALDFEGRSFPGWHHHMTMVSAAYTYRHLSRVGNFH